MLNYSGEKVISLDYGYGRDSIALWVVQAERPVPADEKSGLHFCFTPDLDSRTGFRHREWQKC